MVEQSWYSIDYLPGILLKMQQIISLDSASQHDSIKKKEKLFLGNYDNKRI